MVTSLSRIQRGARFPRSVIWQANIHAHQISGIKNSNRIERRVNWANFGRISDAHRHFLCFFSSHFKRLVLLVKNLDGFLECLKKNHTTLLSHNRSVHVIVKTYCKEWAQSHFYLYPVLFILSRAGKWKQTRDGMSSNTNIPNNYIYSSHNFLPNLIMHNSYPSTISLFSYEIYQPMRVKPTVSRHQIGDCIFLTCCSCNTPLGKRYPPTSACKSSQMLMTG